MNNNSLIDLTVQGDSQVKLSGDFQTLADLTTGTFTTDGLNSFIDFLTKSQKDPAIFFDMNQLLLIAFDVDDVKKPVYHTQPAATCKLTWHPAMKYFFENSMDNTISKNAIVSQHMGIDQLGDLLEDHKQYLDEAGLTFLEHVKNISFKKVISVKRKLDNDGNFNYDVSSESGDNDKIAPPEFLNFCGMESIDHDSLVSFSLVPKFKYEVNTASTSVSMTFKLRSTKAMIEIFEQIGNSVVTRLESAGFEHIYSGGFNIQRATDAWQYKVKPIVIDEQ